MPSIKDPIYKLPVIEPLQKHKTFVTSANKPLLIRGIDIKTQEKNDYVVKLMRAERMSESAAMRELLAAFIAMELELPVALPAVILLSHEFVSILKDDPEVCRIAEKSVGYNFGNLYVDNLQVLATHQHLPNTLRDTGIEILAFDVFIQNADRSHEPPRKPNILTNGKELLIFDHEVAFGFVFELSFNRNKEPWVIREFDKLSIEKHCLFRSLKGHVFDAQHLLYKFAKLDSDFWTRAWELLPDAWKDKEQFDTIKEYLDQVVNRKEAFIKNLQLLLS
jgi:hypothetical protein